MKKTQGETTMDGVTNRYAERKKSAQQAIREVKGFTRAYRDVFETFQTNFLTIQLLPALGELQVRASKSMAAVLFQRQLTEHMRRSLPAQAIPEGDDGFFLWVMQGTVKTVLIGTQECHAYLNELKLMIEDQLE